MPIVAGSEINDDPYHPVSAPRPRPRRRDGRRHPDRLGAPRPALRREAGHPRHLDRRPHRRGRPDQGGRGPLPLRRAHAALRPDPPHQPRHLRHQRAARPGRAHPGRPAQRAGGARRADPRLQGPAAPRRAAGRLGQPGGLHQPRPDHHAAEGPLRLADPHPLPARRGDRGGHRPPGGPALRGGGRQGVGARPHDRDRRHALPAGPPQRPHLPALGRVGAPLGEQLRDHGRQRRPAGAVARRGRGRAPHLRSRGAPGLDRRARSRSRPSRRGARARSSTTSSARRSSRCSATA